MISFKLFSKVKKKFPDISEFKGRSYFDLMPGVIHKYTVTRCYSSYYGEMDIHLKTSGEHIGTWLVTFVKFKPSKENAIRDLLLICNNIPSFEEFNILALGIISKFIKSKKACLSRVVDLLEIRILVLINCFFFTITRILNVFVML